MIRKTPPKRIYLLLRLIQDNITYHPAFMVIRSILIRSTSGVYPLMILPSTCLNANICRYRQDKLIIHRSAPIGSMTNQLSLSDLIHRGNQLSSGCIAAADLHQILFPQSGVILMMYAEDGELCHDPSNISGGMISKQKLKRSHPA